MANVLTNKDANAQMTGQIDNNNKPKSMEYHRAVLESKVKDGKLSNNYISPSDTIQSPATQKLAAFKNKHMGQSMKPKTLFAKTVASNAANSGIPPNAKPMFGDISSQSS